MLDDDPHRAAAGARVARGGRDGRRRDLLLLARDLQPARPGATVSTTERLSSEGWQSCSSCHFEGLTDGIVWQFGTGPRKSVPLNATLQPATTRTTSGCSTTRRSSTRSRTSRPTSATSPGPGRSPRRLPCSAPPPATSTLDPNHGLLIGDNGDINLAPCVINAFAKANAGRPQHTVTLPGSSTQVPALTALREWVKLAVRTPKGPSKRSGVAQPPHVAAGQPGPHALHAGGLRRLPRRRQVDDQHQGLRLAAGRRPSSSPRRRRPATVRRADRRAVPEPLPARHRLLQPRRARAGPTRSAPTSAAIEKASPALNAAGVAGPAPDALGTDYNGDGRGIGYNVPSLLGIDACRPSTTTAPARASPAWSATRSTAPQNGKTPDRLPNAARPGAGREVPPVDRRAHEALATS